MLASLILAAAFAPSATAAITPAFTVMQFLSHTSSTSTLLELAAMDAHRYLRSLVCGSGYKTSCTRVVRITSDAYLENLRNSSAVVVVALREDVPLGLRSSAFDSAVRPSANTLDVALSTLAGDEHIVHSTLFEGRVVTVCSGATPRATLYAVYTLLERAGARFYLHGDVLPPPRATLTLGAISSLVLSPRFEVRGLQPFHDFPMGPDWWNTEYWAATATQMAKLKLNTWVRLFMYVAALCC
jgi:hypothetical protein